MRPVHVTYEVCPERKVHQVTLGCVNILSFKRTVGSIRSRWPFLLFQSLMIINK